MAITRGSDRSSGREMSFVADKTLTRMWHALPGLVGTVVSEETTLDDLECSREWLPGGNQYYARLELAEPHSGTVYLVFELALAIACAGRLVVRPERAIRENIERLTFDGDDLDAMGECVNTFCAALNEGLQGKLGDAYRVVFREGSREAPDASLLGPLGLARGRLVLGGLATGALSLVIPDAVFVAVRDAADEHDETEREHGDEGEDEDPPAADDDDDDDDTSHGKPRQRKARKHEPRKAAVDDGESAGPLLSPEELAAIREATRAPVRGVAMIVAERANAQQQWRESLIGTGAEFEIVANFHQLLTVCRLRVVESIVVDADACSAGGLTLLAAIRGQSGVPHRRVVVASRPTQTHLVACIGGGASEYVCRPLDEETLARIVGPAT